MGGPKLGRGTLYHMMARGIFLACDLLIHIYIARVLGPEAYGLYGVVLALLAIISQPLNVGLAQSVSKYVAEDHARARSILYHGLKTQIVLVFILMALFIGFSGPVSHLLKSPVIGDYMVLAAIILPGLGILTILLGLLNGMRYFSREALALSSYPLVRTLAAVTLIYMGYGVYGAIWGFICGIVFSVFLAGVLLRVPEEQVGFDGKELKAFAVPVLILGVLMIGIPNLDLLFVKGMIVDEKEVGIYNSAKVIARAMYFFFLAIGSTIFPSISESVALNDAKRTIQYIKQGIRYLMMMSLPVACLVSAFGTEIISSIFSRLYSTSSSALSILMFGFTFMTLFSVLTTILMASGRPKLAMTLGLILLPVDTLLNITLIPRYNLVGAALATSFTSFIGVVMASVMIFRRFGVLLEVRSLLKIMISCLTIYILAISLPLPSLWKAVWAVILICGYGVLLILLGELGREDWDILKRLIPGVQSATITRY